VPVVFRAAAHRLSPNLNEMKVFWFFFSKKNRLRTQQQESASF
jgi:hypothetical protein